MLGSKRSILAILVILSSFISVSTSASMQIIHSLDFPSPSQEIISQTKSVAEIKNCKNNKECKTLAIKTTSE